MVRDIQSLVSYEGRLILVFRPVVFRFRFVPAQRLHLR
jgi:ABC-type polysaccharide/polyol phosphate export permease